MILLCLRGGLETFELMEITGSIGSIFVAIRVVGNMVIMYGKGYCGFTVLLEHIDALKLEFHRVSVI